MVPDDRKREFPATMEVNMKKKSLLFPKVLPRLISAIDMATSIRPENMSGNL
jgi:hypothetical protein